ncbi:DUF3828 domain-containing protein [Scandinavium goeteborgense]|jgi:hypothetical protein|uniref:DUF3828 domain-containing protein n=1 Tax=Scandinavium goeteborgense TaxID=1851514 RepID=UPI000D7CBB10
MRKILIVLLLTPAVSIAADDFSAPIKKAIEFNQWYIKQIEQDKYPLMEGHDIDRYVTVSTLKKLRAAEGDDAQYYDADYFIRSQYIGKDWAQNVQAVASGYDPICFNVYVSYGKDKKHTVIDCMIKEGRIWKIDRVTNADF